MKKILIIISATHFLFLMLATQVHAFGIGAYGMVSNDAMPNVNAGGGLIIDTNCAGDKLFNDRIAIGGIRSLYYGDDSGTASKESKLMTKISITNIFGFGVARNEICRFWIGPQVGMHIRYYRSNPDLKVKYQYNITNGKLEIYPTIMGGTKTKDSLIGAGLGLSLGLNFNLPHDMALSIEGGGRYYFYYGIEQTVYPVPFVNYITPDVPILFYYKKDKWTKQWGGIDAYMSIAVLYRVNDSFVSGGAQIENK